MMPEQPSWRPDTTKDAPRERPAPGDAANKLDALEKRAEAQGFVRMKDAFDTPLILRQVEGGFVEGKDALIMERALRAALSIPEGTTLYEYCRTEPEASPYKKTRVAVDGDGASVTVTSEFHPAEGRRKAHAVFTFDGGRPWLNVAFDEDGTPVRTSQMKDPFNAWGQFLALRGEGKASAMLKPGDPAFAEYFAARKTSEKLHPLPKILERGELLQSGVQHVGIGDVRVADLDTPLATDNLWVCTGLSVVDRASKKHLLAHVNGGNDSADPKALKAIRAALEGFDLQRSDVTLVLGDSGEGTANQTYRFLRDTLRVPAERIRIVPPRKAQRPQDVEGENFVATPAAKETIHRAYHHGGSNSHDRVYKFFREQERTAREKTEREKK